MKNRVLFRDSCLPCSSVYVQLRESRITGGEIWDNVHICVIFMVGFRWHRTIPNSWFLRLCQSGDHPGFGWQSQWCLVLRNHPGLLLNSKSLYWEDPVMQDALSFWVVVTISLLISAGATEDLLTWHSVFVLRTKDWNHIESHQQHSF